MNGVDVDCQIASDNVAGAKMATEYLVETIGEGTPVAELQGTTGASATIDRGAGFHEVADEKLDVTGSQTADFRYDCYGELTSGKWFYQRCICT